MGSPPEMATPEGSQKRYAELKESVRVLRAQVRGSHVASPTNDASGPVKGLDDGTLLEVINPQESFTIQHLRLQFKMELQKKKEEIQKLIANQRGKSQQIENLEKEHRVQKKKLEARTAHQSEKICALEAQLSHRITLHQQANWFFSQIFQSSIASVKNSFQKMQELQAQAYAFAAKLRQCENEKCEQMEAVRSEQVATVAAAEEQHRAELGKVSTIATTTDQAQVIYVLSLRRAEDAKSKVKELEAELVGLKNQISHSRELSIKKDEEINSKMDKIIAVYEDQIRDLKARLKREKDELERVKEDLSKKHALELQSYKMQKAREIDQVSERVRSAVESREATIAQLKEELAKQQQQQASCLLDIS